MTKKTVTHHHPTHPEEEYNTTKQEELTSTAASEPAPDVPEADTASAHRPQFKVEELASEPEGVGLNPEAFPETQDIDQPETDTTPSAEFEADTQGAGMEQFGPTYEPPDTAAENSPPRPDWRWQRSKPRQFPLWLVAAGAAALLLGIGLWRLKAGKSTEPQPSPKVNEILLETSSPSPSPEPEEDDQEIKRQDFKVQVLNGSGITGAAGKLAQVLESAGFEDVATGNADNFDTKGILIRVKDGQDKLADLIEQDLEDDYDSIKVKDDLDKDSQYDAVVIRGSQPGDKEEDKVLGEKDEVSQPSDKTSTSSADTD